MNPLLADLQPYPFEKLAKLKHGVRPPAERSHINLSIGEPQHPTPHVVTETLIAHLHGLANYPMTRGLPALRQAIADWVCRRFEVPAGVLDPERQVLPVNGTREALFSLAQCVVRPRGDAWVLMPNPFYQIYEGAALLAGGRPYFLNLRDENGFLPDFDRVPDAVWQGCELIYICSPGNPSGAVMSVTQLRRLIELADRWGFVIASDECYSELYRDENRPPPGLLQAAQAMGNSDFRHCVVFHSLSKRSNAPGLRSGFVAGDAELLKGFALYRTYHGCAMSPPVQHASIAAWGDELHVRDNRESYRRKFAAVYPILSEAMDVDLPEAGFYLWPRTPIDDAEFARFLFANEHVTVLPGSFLSRDSEGGNPGARRIRIALVAPLDECVEAAHRIRQFTKDIR